MKKVIKTGILSFGMSGSLFHCPFLNVHTGFELRGIVERHIKKAHLIYPSIISYNSINDIINDSEIELVVINTPSLTHFEFALKAIKAKKHILVEKPFTVTSKQAEILYLEAKKNNCFVMPYQNRRYDSDFLSVKKIVESGKLGSLIEVHFRYDRYKYEISNNAVKEFDLPGNGLLYNLGAHVIDAAITLFGIPKKWSKVKRKIRPNTQIDDYASVHLEFENGLQVFTTVSLLVADAQASFVLHGTRGSYIKSRCDVQEAQLQSGMSITDASYGVEAVNKEGVLTIIDNGISHKEKIESEKSSYLNIFEDVYQTIRNNALYPVTEAQIIKQIEILED
jgi:predicted dehydrogenase